MARSNDERSLRAILEGFLFYVGIPALTLYPLGFVALCIQMWRDDLFPYSWDFGGLDFGMTWYAASLVPKVVVVGTGVRLLIISLLACVLAMGIASLIFNVFRQWHLRQRSYLIANEKRRDKWEMLFWRLSFLTLLPLAAYITWSDFEVDSSWYDLPFLAAFVVFCAVAGGAIVHMRHRESGRRFLHGLAAAYAASVLAALSLSALQLPDLPLVELTANAESMPQNLPDEPLVLLANQTGYWHVYNRASGLISVPDDEAKVVRHWNDTETDKPVAERDVQR